MTTAVNTDDEMSDSEMWRIHKEQSQQKRASNREYSADALAKAGIGFARHNGGAHLVVEAKPGHMIDFWPGTGKWMARRDNKPRRGLQPLLNYIRRVKEQP